MIQTLNYSRRRLQSIVDHGVGGEQRCILGRMKAAPPLCERIDLAAADGRQRLDALRGKLVSQGDVVSPASRQRTIDVFGEPLSPRQVIARICEDEG